MFIKRGAFISNPQADNSASSKLCGRQSKALERSVSSTPRSRPWSTLICHFSRRAIKQCCEPCSLQKLHWYFESISSKKLDICLYTHRSKTFDKLGNILTDR